MGVLNILLKAIKDDIIDFNFRELKKAILKVNDSFEQNITNIITNNYPALNTRVGYISADVTSTSSTPANVTGLSFTVTSGKFYSFRFCCVVESASALIGYNIALTTPTFSTFAATCRTMQSTDGTGGEFQGRIRVSGTAVTVGAVPGANQQHMMEVSGTIAPTADGTVQFQFANETGATQVTLRKGSSYQVIEMG